MRGRLETLWANSERLEMLASKEPVARRQVEIYVRIRFTCHSAAVLLIFCIIYQLSHWIPRQHGVEWINWRVISRCASNNSYTFLFSQIQFSSNDDLSLRWSDQSSTYHITISALGSGPTEYGLSEGSSKKGSWGDESNIIIIWRYYRKKILVYFHSSILFIMFDIFCK